VRSLSCLSGILLLWTSLGVHEVVPPSEGRGVVSDEVVVVSVVVFSTGPEWNEVMKRPWEVVTRVGVNSLQQSEDNPASKGKQMQITSLVSVDDWEHDGTGT